MTQEPLWHILIAAGLLLLFAGTGVYMTFKPDPFVPRPLFWKQGEMERTMNRDSVRLLGVGFAVGALWLLYILLFGE